MSSDTLSLTRRGFLKVGTAATGGVLLGFYLPRKARGQVADAATSHAPNAFVRIGTDNTVTVIVNHSEMGQGVFTSQAMMLAEELEADWSTVQVECAPVAPEYNHVMFGPQMATGGSTSTWTEWDRIRTAGATAKTMLVAAAAETWSVDSVSCRAEKGQVLHTDGRKLSYGELAEKAAAVTPPDNVTLKDPADFTIIGQRIPRVDTPEKVDGSALFGLDVSLPGMLTAVVARPPVPGGSAAIVDTSAAKAVPGVRDVFEIDRGVAVVADGYWAALKGRNALVVSWDDGPLASLDSDAQRQDYAAMAMKPGLPSKSVGNAASSLTKSARKVAAVYEMPYLAHCPMEPLNCVADVRADGCDVWTGTQFQTAEWGTAVKITGLPPESVKVHTTYLGGGFGRRATMDCHIVAEAVQISQRMKKPVKLVWPREDDVKGGYYRPAALHAMRGGVDANGNLTTWQQRIVCESFVMGTPLEGMMVHDGVDHAAVEGAAELPYSMPHVQVEWHQAPSGPPTLWWRSVGHSHTAFAIESFLDELIHAAGQDPVDVRRSLLADKPRHLGVLNLAAEKAGWGSELPEGRGRGVAVHESFGSYVAQVAEVSVSEDGEVRVHKVVCAVDCGPVVNPDTIEAQMESAVAFGLSAALLGEITFKDGQVQQSNFHDYPVLRMNEMPEVETHIVTSTDKMGGIGEPGLPPIAPAVGNAIFAATGKRVRRLPIGKVEMEGERDERGTMQDAGCRKRDRVCAEDDSLGGHAGCDRLRRFASSPLDVKPAAVEVAPAVVTSVDEAAGVEAFLKAYEVFMHPRCVNCHPIGDVPMQGDEGELHTQLVQRGKDGHGIIGMKCSACHMTENLAGAGMPPGSPNWHLAPAGMAFEGQSPADLARRFKDPKMNGGVSVEKAMDHLNEDPLVLWGWDPGDGRSVPEMSHPEFLEQVQIWLANGAPVPGE